MKTWTLLLVTYSSGKNDQNCVKLLKDDSWFQTVKREIKCTPFLPSCHYLLVVLHFLQSLAMLRWNALDQTLYQMRLGLWKEMIWSTSHPSGELVYILPRVSHPHTYSKAFTVHYKLTKSWLLPILDGHVTFIKRKEYKDSPNYNDTNSSRN